MSELPHQAVDVAAAFAELADLSVSPQPLADILHRTVELARDVLSVPAEASITVVAGDDAKTPAATGDVAIALDEMQYRHEAGPCLAAAQAGGIIAVEDIADDARWPQFAAAAVSAGIHSSLSLPLPVQRQVIGALNVYSRQVRAFTAPRVRLAEQFATYAAVAIANTTLYMSSTQLAVQMQQALSSRAVIEQAKGILMALHKCDADRAFEILVDASQKTHRKLRDVATELVEQAVRG